MDLDNKMLNIDKKKNNKEKWKKKYNKPFFS